MKTSKARGRRLTHITAECGHQFRTAWPAGVLAGKTTDCHLCGALLIFPEDSTRGTAVTARLFDSYMHELDEQWPADGTGTFALEF